MTILAQHGWGKTDKIQRGLVDGAIHGMILSPRDELPANLSSFISKIQLAFPTTERFVDPLFHIGTIWPVNDGKLERYPHYQRHLDPTSFSPAGIQRFVTDTLQWQSTLDVSGLLSPTVMVDDLASQWAQIAMMMAQETISQYGDSRPLYVSLVVSEDALRQRLQVDNWLDELTRLDVDGFYLVVRRSYETYRQHYDPDVLFSLLRVCYSLAELNQYRVYSGYTDMIAPLLHAVGVAGTASGWSAGLRQFTLRRFKPRTFGRQPHPRYSSSPLLNSIYVTELDGIHAGGQIAQVLSSTPHDQRFRGTTNPENVAWPKDDAAVHHWHALAILVQSIAATRTTDRLNLTQNRIAHARGLYAQTGRLVPFTNETGSTHLDQWLDALNRFRIDARV